MEFGIDKKELTPTLFSTNCFEILLALFSSDPASDLATTLKVL